MFLVVWAEGAFDDMDRIVRDHPARKREFALALRQITRQLTDDPERIGESREDEMRVMFAGELSVFYSVDADDKTVEIGSVRLRRP
jgi:hypothetical protein